MESEYRFLELLFYGGEATIFSAQTAKPKN